MCYNSSATASTAASDYQLPLPAVYLSAAVAILSALCSLAIVASHLMLRCLTARRHRGAGNEAQSRLLIVFISLSDVVVCAMNSTGSLRYAQQQSTTGTDGGDLRLCQVQAAIGIFASLAFVCWVASFVVFLYLMIPCDNIRAAIKYRGVFHIVSWGIPLAMVLVAYFMGALPQSVTGATSLYGRATVGWCWIGEYPRHPEGLACDGSRLLWMLVTGRGWEILAYAIMAVLAVLIRSYVMDLTSPLSARYAHPSALAVKSSMRSISNKAYVLVISFILLRIWGTIRVFFDYGRFFGEHQTLNDVFAYLQAVGDNAQGIVNFILFVAMSPKIRNDLSAMFHARCPCCCLCCQRYERLEEERLQRQEEERFQRQQATYRDLNYAQQRTTSRRSPHGPIQDDVGGVESPRVWVVNPDELPSDSLSSTAPYRPAVTPRRHNHRRHRAASNTSAASSAAGGEKRSSMELTVSYASMSSLAPRPGPDSLSLGESSFSRPPSSVSSERSHLSGRSLQIATPITEQAEPRMPFDSGTTADASSSVAASGVHAPVAHSAPLVHDLSEALMPAPTSHYTPEALAAIAAASTSKTPLLSDTDDLLP